MTDKDAVLEPAGPGPAPVSRAIQPWLVKLLRSMFTSNEELRQFLGMDAGLDIDGDVPDVRQPKNDYAAGVADILIAGGHLTRDFFEALVKARPRRESEIRTFEKRVSHPAFRALWLVTHSPRAWLSLVAGLVVFAVVAYQLGVEAHRARVVLIGMDPDSFTYSAWTLLSTGLAGMVRLGWYALIGPLAGLGIERTAPVLLAGLVVVAVLLLRIRRTRAALVWLAMVVPVLGCAMVLYANGVGVTDIVMGPTPPDRSCNPGKSLPRQISFEVCSWLENESSVNDGRRLALAGVWGWLALASGLVMWLAVRAGRAVSGTSPTSRVWRRAGVAVAALQGVVFALLLPQAPRAFAMGHWGLRYPRVARVHSGCQPALNEVLQRARATGQADRSDYVCRVLHVSEGATRDVVILVGADCPPGPNDARPGETYSVTLTPPDSAAGGCVLDIGDIERIPNSG
ncbi:MAG: hypothetical protein MJE77_23925 [Proteobacteria bacterium]|nr:hypothetical protein [Pseudomonadota bacterium]